MLRAAHPRRRTIRVSPEVADLLERLDERFEGAREPAEQHAPEAESPPHDDDGRIAALAALEEEVSRCTRCGLCDGRTQTVFSDGSPFARLVFVGEAPGEWEDKKGKPFVGAAGRLLTDIIVKGMKRRREDVYICNVLKCRPPGNRNPLPEEVAKCEPYLIRQLELIRPAVICTLGSFAAQCLLKTQESVGRLRGKWHTYHGIPLRVTYHPAYLLRNPKDKGKAWEDIQQVMKLLDGETESPGKA